MPTDNSLPQPDGGHDLEYAENLALWVRKQRAAADSIDPAIDEVDLNETRPGGTRWEQFQREQIQQKLSQSSYPATQMPVDPAWGTGASRFESRDGNNSRGNKSALVGKIMGGLFIALWLLWGLNQCVADQRCVENAGVEGCGFEPGTGL
jgi:hypothetical protein